MSDTDQSRQTVLTTQDGTTAEAIARKGACAGDKRLRAFLLIAPLLIFVLITFVAPIVDMLFRSVENGIVPTRFRETVIALQEWDPAIRRSA